MSVSAETVSAETVSDEQIDEVRRDHHVFGGWFGTSGEYHEEPRLPTWVDAVEKGAVFSE